MPIPCVPWLQSRSVFVFWAAASCGLLAMGCSDDSHRLGGGEETSAVGKRPPTLCSEGADIEIIDRMEDADGTINMTADRGGVWFSFNDETPGTQTPLHKAETFAMSEVVPPRSGSHYAAHSQGGGFTVWGAGIGFELYNQQPYDVSKYAGITFWARRGPDVTSALRFGVSDIATAPRGGQCPAIEDPAKCSDYFGADLTLTTSFQRFSFTWQELAQEGWGFPLPPSVDTEHVYGIRFITGENEDFDFWVDDIALLCHAQ